MTAAVAMTANVVHILVDRWSVTGEQSWLALALGLAGGAAAAGVVMALVWRRRVVELFASLRFASSVVAVLLLATAAGTMILQSQPEERFREVYGGAADTLYALHLHDLFHSYWFMAVLGLMCVSLVVDAAMRFVEAVRKKRDRWVPVGFFFTHGGVVVALAGGLVTMSTGDKGMIDLVKGMTADGYTRLAPKPGQPEVGELGFGIRLDDFELEYYDPAYSLYLYEFTGAAREDGHRDVKALAALPTKVGERRSFGGRHAIEVIGVDVPDAGAAGSSLHRILVDGGAAVPVTLGGEVAIGGGARLQAIAFLPHFNYDIRNKRAFSASDKPENPALEVRILEADGKETYRGWLFANQPGFEMGGHGAKLTRPIVYRYAQPAIRFAVTTDGKPTLEDASLPLGASGTLPIEEGRYAVAFNTKGDRIKQFHSTISLIDGGEVVIDRRPLSVNHPVSYGGFDFYQSNYRAWDLSYSGVMVVRDPGLAVVYAGMGMMLLGILYVLYVRRWRTAGRTTDDDSAGATEVAA